MAEERKKRLALAAAQGSLDAAYSPLILATTAAAMGWEVGIFFTFFGFDIINKKRMHALKVAPIANPAFPEPIPAVPVKVPNIIGTIPGMTHIATAFMKNWMGRAKLPTIPEFVEMAQEMGVRLFACSMTMGVMGVKEEDLIDGAELVGATTFLDFAADADVSLYM
ncbi:MAG: peroxiredoxin family protein [Chloroflexi bacterium B3_Chlor]|nr:MAG: peroxiredoxin family protein [Chloroflexi bacterium B3_Chlor]